jgi:hypothetical protein
MSYVHPHLGQACDHANLSTVTVDLLADDPYPKILGESEPLRLALGGLKERFKALLQSEGFSSHQLSVAKLCFEFEPGFPDYYCSKCNSYIEEPSGKHFSHAVDYLGTSVAPNHV